ncbi:endonuclease/exonuclease/phosphatase family protein [Streptomyces sp. NPDC002403]
MGAINDIIDDSDRPTVLVGDLNATPDTPEVAQVTEHLDDTWLTAGQGPGHTYDALDPHERIDYVLASPGIDAHRARVLGAQGSDHLPVSVGITLP